MSKPIIKVENLSKSYLIGHQSNEKYTALRDVLTNSVKGFIRNAGNMFRGEQLMGNDKVEEFFALKDINFEINQGDRVGIIGRNGAGKSTLLKVLSRITEPTSGRISINGRVASLLEVGTGFHPELSGRENIYLNGAILGMSRVEVKQKFDEIVSFAEVEKFLDTPVKRYSSGMYVRLAFAVAAHLEPEILIVDEVLAVGDSKFQQKCIGKMEEVSKEGRTVLFVSHNLGSISKLCNKGIMLENGQLVFNDSIEKTIAQYNKKGVISNDYEKIIRKDKSLGVDVRIVDIGLLNSKSRISNIIEYCEPFQLFVRTIHNETISDLNFGIRIDASDGSPILSALSGEQDIFISNKKETEVKINFRGLFLVPGSYFLTCSVRKNGQFIDELIDCFEFEVSNVPFEQLKPHNGAWGPVKFFPNWNVNGT